MIFALAWRNAAAPAGVHASRGVDAGARHRREQRRVRAARRRAADGRCPTATRRGSSSSGRRCPSRTCSRSKPTAWDYAAWHGVHSFSSHRSHPARRVHRWRATTKPGARAGARRHGVADADARPRAADRPRRSRRSRIRTRRAGRRCSATVCGGGDTAAIQPSSAAASSMNDRSAHRGRHHAAGRVAARPARGRRRPVAADAHDGRRAANAISHNYTILARLADGTSLEQATAELEAFAARDGRGTSGVPRAHRRRLVPVGEQTVRAIRPTLLVSGRRRRAAAAGGLRERGDAAHRPGGEPAARARGPRRARRDPLAPPVAGGCRVPGDSTLGGVSSG